MKRALLALALMLGATLSVTVVLEAGGWSREMPPHGPAGRLPRAGEVTDTKKEE